MTLVERLRANGALPVCPFDRRSPDYYTTPNDQPCKFCGGEPEGPDKCTGADMRVMAEAADRIESLEAELSKAREAAQAVIDRWDTPAWKDTEPTATVINRLRNSLSHKEG